MTRPDILTCIHEPFGDAFYFGPERLSPRYENNEPAREQSGFADSTYKTIFERIERDGKEVRSMSLCAAGYNSPLELPEYMAQNIVFASTSKQVLSEEVSSKSNQTCVVPQP